MQYVASCSTLTGQQPRSLSYFGAGTAGFAAVGKSGSAAERLNIEKVEIFMMAGGQTSLSEERLERSSGGGEGGGGGSPLPQIAE